MNSKKLFNILEDFDFNLVNDSEFKEDSVREEIVVPIIKGLGYSANKPNQIIRSRKLLHPYVSIGSKRKEIYIIPDYLFEVNGKPSWILDAKSPTESVIQTANAEQAYSYAIHSEVRVKYFALCNGIEFALYNIEEIKPILHFPLKAIPLYWETLKQYLAPENIFINSPFIMKKDLGLHLKRLGFDQFEKLIFPIVPIHHIAQMDPDYFSFSSAVSIDEVNYVVTFDFGQNVLEELKDKIPEKAIELLSVRNGNSRQVVKFGDTAFYINAECKIGEKLEENDKEIFLPLWITNLIN